MYKTACRFMQRFDYREMAAATPFARGIVNSQQPFGVAGRGSGVTPMRAQDTAMAIAFRRAGFSR
jgi:hypothetical protein